MEPVSIKVHPYPLACILCQWSVTFSGPTTCCREAQLLPGFFVELEGILEIAFFLEIIGADGSR